ncbi:methyl-accepting chemotaxis protein [Clostridium cellulovorans]|uniref:Methyl-accepting chemotaxis sensory transducer n=1 Tax=Clostridium cellulovorans (strain ATCC 35296 / DSM 3052 / OCM 3 / 743B) TaxID=573061 RepID=D9SRT2_CLOC7|nr:methyl-accepting chemotaxis protein [Clostridium cellulovorans]ADL50449.1 methyl-accepting chemotaxis sensory transducer [Clostridium cellulovorans 743B]
MFRKKEKLSQDTNQLESNLNAVIIPKNAYENIVGELKATTTSIDSNIHEVASKLSDFKHNIDDISSYSEDHSPTNGIKDILSDFNTEMEVLSDNINNVHTTVVDTSKLADKGLGNIVTLNSSLSELQNAFSSSSSIVSDLVSKIESVNSITDSISQIASQTNLLALNAAIEAARAGEAGKGFGVVADEIRKLAESSKSAVENITKILEEIKNDIMNTSSAMSTAGNAIDMQNTTVKTTKDTFGDIKTSIDGAVELIDKAVKNLVSSTSLKDKISSESDALASKLSYEIKENMSHVVSDLNNQIKNVDKISNSVNKLNEISTNISKYK